MSSEVIGKLITDFNNLNEKCVHLVEENQNLKQQNQNLLQENQILKEKLQEKDKQFERLQERDKQYEKLEQHVKNLEKQKSEELQQLRQLEIISQNLHNNLGILGSDKTKKNDNTDGERKNDIKITEEKNKFLTNKNDEQKNHNMDKPPTLSSNNKGVENSSEYLLNFFNTKKDTEVSGLYSNIQIVVGLDFGSISSAFSIYRVTAEVPNSFNYSWQLKDTNLVYQSNSYSNMIPNSSINKYFKFNIVGLFKLHLGGLPDNLKPKLPIEYKKAITDYFKGIGKDIKNEIARWSGVNYFENVLLILTVPADYSEKDKDILRECTHNGKLIKNKSSEKLQFITESEAAAIYCMKYELQKYNLLSIGKTFIIVDCGGNNDISSSILKYTYGIQFTSDWKNGDPSNRKTSDGKISKFISLVKRGTEVTSDQIFTFNFKPKSGQTHVKFKVYYTNEESATYIDESGMKLLGVLNVDLPDAHLDNRSINFGLTFGPNIITASTRNELNGQKFVTKFCYQ
ncbi:unnamed protein product [Rhizophagus irregularis]|nr:unnamed protein product [Rhizophagus irregularis]